MQRIILLEAILLGVICLLFFLALRPRNKTHDRLRQVLYGEHIINDPLAKRIFRFAFQKIGNLLLRIIPPKNSKSLENKIKVLDIRLRDLNVSLKEFLVMRVLMTLIVFVASIALLYVLTQNIGSTLIISLIIATISYVLPEFILSRQINKRKVKIEDMLPDVLDLLTISIEAGLGLDSAIIKVGEKMPGPLSYELLRGIEEIKIGKSKKDSFHDLGIRADVDSLKNVLSALIQADQLGVSVGSVLRTQSNQIRLARRQRAEERAQKVPIKMMIPLVLFVFPSIMVVILGPTLIQVMINNSQ